MRDFLALVIFLLLLWVILTVSDSKGPDDQFGKFICGNVNCYYELDKK